jgi:FkbM family methyltransferase
MIPTDFITEDTILVQIGANDGIQDDFMREIILSKNIKAHLLEPIPVFYEQLSSLYADSDRVFCYNVAIHEHSGSAVMTYVNDPYLPIYTKGLGTFDTSKNAFSLSGNYQLKDDLSDNAIIKAITEKKKQVNVHTLTLSDFLEKNNINTIDIFVTDAEGFDGIIFSQLDLKKYTPEIIVMETHTLGEDQNNHIKAKLKKYNYEILVDGWDTVGRKK